jgi:hypothetical protein
MISSRCKRARGLHGGESPELADGQSLRKIAGQSRLHKKFFGQIQDNEISLIVQFAR